MSICIRIHALLNVKKFFIKNILRIFSSEYLTDNVKNYIWGYRKMGIPKSYLKKAPIKWWFGIRFFSIGWKLSNAHTHWTAASKRFIKQYYYEETQNITLLVALYEKYDWVLIWYHSITTFNEMSNILMLFSTAPCISKVAFCNAIGKCIMLNMSSIPLFDEKNIYYTSTPTIICE